MLGQRILLDVVGAAVIGGVSLFGGKGKVIWVVFGALFLTVVDKGLSLLGLSLASVFAIKGGVILAAAIVDAQRQRFAAGLTADAAAAIEGLCKSFFGVQVLHDVGLELQAGRGAGPGRRERLRQVDDHEHPGRRAPARPGHDDPRRPALRAARAAGTPPRAASPSSTRSSTSSRT